MAGTPVKELRGLPEPELHQRINQLRRELDSLHLRASQGLLEHPHEIGIKRREIARMFTVIAEQRGQNAKG